MRPLGRASLEQLHPSNALLPCPRGKMTTNLKRCTRHKSCSCSPGCRSHICLHLSSSPTSSSPHIQSSFPFYTYAYQYLSAVCPWTAFDGAIVFYAAALICRRHTRLAAQPRFARFALQSASFTLAHTHGHVIGMFAKVALQVQLQHDGTGALLEVVAASSIQGWSLAVHDAKASGPDNGPPPHVIFFGALVRLQCLGGL